MAAQATSTALSATLLSIVLGSVGLLARDGLATLCMGKTRPSATNIGTTSFATKPPARPSPELTI